MLKSIEGRLRRILSDHKSLRLGLLSAVASGLLYGVLAQVIYRFEHTGTARGQVWSTFIGFFAVMSFGYVLLMPVVLGAMTVGLSGRWSRSWWFNIFGPWITTLLMMIMSFAVGWEGSICVVMFTPLALVMSSLGGVATGLYVRSTRKLYKPMLLVLILLPFATSAAESHFPNPTRVDGAKTSIRIKAPQQVVWNNIIRVRTIHEPQRGLFHFLGFPKPVEATLSHPGVGAVRHAQFERGLVFLETVTAWEPQQRLAFDIDVDPSHTPLTTLDAHVTVGGSYFDVMRGEYRIETHGLHDITLHLASQYRVSTRFNFYAGWWAHYLMSDIQNNILQVIKARCERIDNAS